MENPIVPVKSEFKPDLKRSGYARFWNTGVVGSLMVLVALICVVARGPIKFVTDSGHTATPASIALSAKLIKAFEKAAPLKVGARVVFWSDYLSEQPDTLSTLGDGPEVNDIAPADYAHLNSIMFVESVMALARSEQPGQFFDKLVSIRYKNAQSEFFSRNYSIEGDWIPNNESAGNLNDITARLADEAGERPERVSVSIDRAAWLSAQEKKGGISRSIASLAAHQGVDSAAWAAPRSVRVTFFPISKISKIYEAIPDGSLIHLVHEKGARGQFTLTDPGIVVRENGKVLLRKASPEGLIKTVALKEYLRESAGIVGVNLNQVNR